MLVSDLMCSRGYMQQIGRHGIAGTKDSVLARAAFEITVPTIAHAALVEKLNNSKVSQKMSLLEVTFQLEVVLLIYTCK